MAIRKTIDLQEQSTHSAGSAESSTSGKSELSQPRKRLPDTRRGVTHKFDIAGTEGYIRTGEYEDGSLGEIFINISKQGSTLSGALDGLAIMTSIALQYGVPVVDIVKKFSFSRYEPSGITPNADIRFAYSISDYIFRWIGINYLSTEEQVALNIRAEASNGSSSLSDNR